MNWINSWKSNKKKRIYRTELRFGKLTVIEIEVNPPLKRCKCKNTKTACLCKRKPRLRVLIFNFGFEKT